VCASRKFKASWHPGWKYHALVGNLIAITQLDALEDALQGFVDVEKDLDLKDETLADQKTRLTNQLNDLSSQEGKDYNNIFNSPIPEKLQPHLERWWGDAEGKAEHLSDMELEAFFKMPSFCHTGMLPAEIRFQGLLTENSTNVGTIWDQNYDSVNKYDQVQRFEYDKRNASYVAEYKDPRPEKDGQIMLVEASEDRGDDCEVYTHLDFKDHFYISSREGVRTLTLPNNAEKKYYTEYDATKAKGYILMCLKPVSTVEGMLACCKERCLRLVLFGVPDPPALFLSSASAIGDDVLPVTCPIFLVGCVPSQRKMRLRRAKKMFEPSTGLWKSKSMVCP